MFPVIFGEMLKNNKFYKHFIELVEIFFLLNDQVYDDLKINLIEKKIHTYLVGYKELYPSDPLVAKFHFMIHYGKSIRQFGPPLHYSVMRFESKHGQFKQIDRANHNHVNLTKSLSYRHQNLQLFHLSSKNYFNRDKLGTEINDKSIDLLNNNQFSSYKWLVKDNIEYHINDFLCYECVNETPLFGKITQICHKNKNIIFFLTLFDTLNFFNHLRGYKIEKNNRNLKSIYLNQLTNKFPLSSHDDSLIYLKYPLIF